MSIDLFLALLAPKYYGGVHLPKNFRPAYKDAILETLDESYPLHGEAHYENVKDEVFRKDIESLVKALSFTRAFEYCFRSTGDGSQLLCVDDAKLWHGHYLQHYAEYNQFKESFVPKFGFYCNLEDPQEALIALGQELRVLVLD